MTCLWCNKELKVGEFERGNLCSECEQVSTGIPNLSSEQLDLLPFGLIELDKTGTIVAFNESEERLSLRSKDEVIGKNFFADVAPCADVQDYKGRFDEFLRGSKLSEQFDYIYYFGARAVKVQLTFLRVNQRLALVLSKRNER
ncbi:MAG: hypothetical protein QOH63_1933 [Acidobacteriota bacterium]|jgi:photoactive yellow protein|nr:hypothetical protein [Acidobacteriota bacterium]